MFTCEVSSQRLLFTGLHSRLRGYLRLGLPFGVVLTISCANLAARSRAVFAFLLAASPSTIVRATCVVASPWHGQPFFASYQKGRAQPTFSNA